ncbi:hypothetical protein T484DRAFT_1749696 [Baffinella frigidus]|nr:hypothetical protein T484DRAFT_1749696 [Cryptophyta sp. CCMP2293]
MPCRPLRSPPDSQLLPGSSTRCASRKADCVMTRTALLALILARVVTASEVTTTPSPATPADSPWALVVIIAIAIVCCALCLCSADDEGDDECCGISRPCQALVGQRGARSRRAGGAQVSGASEALKVGMLAAGGAQDGAEV